MSVAEHRSAALETVRFAVLTVSDTRTAQTDESGQLILELALSAFHSVTARALCKDDPATVVKLIDDAVSRPDVDVLIITGGTGLSSRDRTFEAVSGLFDVPIPGFGELFRMLSFEEIGPAAMLSRACAGVIKGRPVFSLPGSLPAVRLAMTRLVLPESGHLLAQLAK